MIKITNNQLLNEVFECVVNQSIKHERHPGYSVTELTKPAEVTILLHRARDSPDLNLEIDLAESSHTLRGHAMDDYVKKALINTKTILPSYTKKGRPKKSDYSMPNVIVGSRMFLMTDWGVPISGEIDYTINETQIHDLKNISRYTYKNLLQPYFEQLNIYAYIRRAKGYEVTALNLDIILTDYRPDDPDIPAPMFTYPVQLMTFEEQRNLVYSRLRKLIEYEGKSNEELINICRQNYITSKLVSYAVKKEGGKRNTRVFDIINNDEVSAFDEATKDANQRGEGYSVIPIVKTIEDLRYNPIKSLL